VSKAGETGRAADAARALSFGAQAELYDRVRPTYPRQAVADVLGRMTGSGSPRRVADVGAGTGKLTAVLLGLGADVDAVEPDAGMRAVLKRRVPTARVHAGSGEDLPLPDAGVDAVLYGQAWHWVDAGRGAEEAARVLRPGGVLAMLWNYEAEPTVWAQALERLVGPQISREIPPPPALPGFGPATTSRRFWSRSQTVASVPDLVGSQSVVLVLPDQQREEVLTTLRQVVQQQLAGRHEVQVPMWTTTWVFPLLRRPAVPDRP
jgi:SAM-dependent methyltransferase